MRRPDAGLDTRRTEKGVCELWRRCWTTEMRRPAGEEMRGDHGRSSPAGHRRPRPGEWRGGGSRSPLVLPSSPPYQMGLGDRRFHFRIYHPHCPKLRFPNLSPHPTDEQSARDRNCFCFSESPWGTGGHGVAGERGRGGERSITVVHTFSALVTATRQPSSG